MHFIRSQGTTISTEIKRKTEHLKSWADASPNTFVQDTKKKENMHSFVKGMAFFLYLRY